MRKIALSIVAASSILVFASGCSSSGSSSGSSQSAAGSSSPADALRYRTGRDVQRPKRI
jgi:uncharacterized protein YceK